MKARTNDDVLSHLLPEMAGAIKARKEVEKLIAAGAAGCAHSVQGEVNRGERRVCLQCGAEHQSMSNSSWIPATEKFKPAGEYDDHDWHYTIEARLDLVKKPLVYEVSWDELFKLRKEIGI